MTGNAGYVYILQSERNNSYYIGNTDNVVRRIEEHNHGRVKYTKNIRPMLLKFFQPYTSLTEARKIEYKLKRLKRKDVIERIIKEQAIKIMGV